MSMRPTRCPSLLTHTTSRSGFPSFPRSYCTKCGLSFELEDGESVHCETGWRRGGDLNPRFPFENTRSPGVRLKPGSATSPRGTAIMPSHQTAMLSREPVQLPQLEQIEAVKPKRVTADSCSMSFAPACLRLLRSSRPGTQVLLQV